MILLTGGTGYVGSYLLAKLRGRGEPVRILARDPTKFQHLATGNVGLAQGDVTDPTSLAKAMEGVDKVIHLVAIIRERPGGLTFERINYAGTINIVDAAKAAGVKRFVHMSALGVRPDPNLPYFDTKFRAQQYVEQSGLAWTVFQPSVVFGEGDEFVNKLADLVRKPLFVLPAPIMPVVGDGATPFQPVWIGDVVDAFVKALDDDAMIGHVYQLGGPRRILYEAMMNEIMAVVGVKRGKLHVPIGLMKLPVLIMDKVLPNPPVTIEQLKMLRLDNSAPDSATGAILERTPKDFKDGIDYVNIPLNEQKASVQKLASGK
ncbi:MAG: complex I NDUFA9 subunit family protein [Herpetosiphonaceae bacterium]|nr:complex I NDUFA9 subunit family protein [Herpetosiphonaceae bacterium]